MTDRRSGTTKGIDEDRRPEPSAGPARGRRGPFHLNDQQKLLLAVVLVVHLILARLTLRDLRRRPASAVRGPKRLWRLWAMANTTGSLAYWVFGRRGSPRRDRLPARSVRQWTTGSAPPRRTGPGTPARSPSSARSSAPVRFHNAR